MNNLRYALVLAMAAGLLPLPWACTKGLGVPPISPTPAATATGTPTLVDINMTSGTTVLSNGAYQFGCVHIGSGATVTIQGAVTVFCTCFTLDAGATITGVGTGYAPNSVCPNFGVGGPAGGSDNGNGNCGALCNGGGHGGNASAYSYSAFSGGTPISCVCPAGLGANDDPVHPFQMGSAGGWPRDGYSGVCYPLCSDGGGLLKVVVYDPVQNRLSPAVLNGTINMGGTGGGAVTPNYELSGAGAGGTILIEASAISGSGNLTANGGGQGTPPAGGGIISLIGDASSFSGTTSVLGGAGGNYGIMNFTAAQSGSVTVTSAPSSGY
jgi:hypothetical protein